MINLLHFAMDCGTRQTIIPSLYNGMHLSADCTPQFASFQDFVTIFGNVIQILLSLAGIVAVGMIIFGGIQYITSTGEPAKIVKAKETILNAIIGLVATMLAFAFVVFLSGRFS